MLVVRESDVGAVAFARLQREGLVHEVLGPAALPQDVPSTPALRWLLAAPYVPRHTWATGLAGLWLRGLAPPPRIIHLVGLRGVHKVVPPAPNPPVEYHSGPRTGLPAGAWRVADVSRACIDALVYESTPAVALPVVARALSLRRTTPRALQQAALRVAKRTTHHARVTGLVAALVAAHADA